MKANTIGEIIFADKFFPLIKNGVKTTTVRSGVRSYPSGLYDVYNPDKSKGLMIRVEKCEVTEFSKLTDKTASTDGFSSVDELKKELLRFYPDLADESPVTIVYFSYAYPKMDGKEKDDGNDI